MREDVIEVVRDTRDVLAKLAQLDLFTCFPIEWYSQSYLADIWMLIFSHVKDTQWINQCSPEDNDQSLKYYNYAAEYSFELLYEFLARCIEVKKESLGSLLVSLYS